MNFMERAKINKIKAEKLNKIDKLVKKEDEDTGIYNEKRAL